MNEFARAISSDDLSGSDILSGECELLDARVSRHLEDWHSWEAARIAAAIEPGDTVIEFGAPVSALTSVLAAKAGWVFAGATNNVELAVLRSALDPVHPANVTFGTRGVLSAWCPRAEVVVAADWSHAPTAELATLFEMAERSLVVTGWRTLSPSADDGIELGVAQALAFARHHGLETRIVSTPADRDYLRTVVILSRYAQTA